MTSESAAEEMMEIGGGRRLALAPDALCVEVRGGSAWVRARVLPYDEIRAVYSYEARDWGFLGLAAGLWLAAAAVSGIAVLISQTSGTVYLMILGVITVLIGGLAAYRILTVPRPLLLVDAYSGTLSVPNRDPVFFRRLALRLPKPDSGLKVEG